jgi:hypothetical protein
MNNKYNYNDIFNTNAVNNIKINVLNIEDIYATIPKECSDKKNIKLQKTNIEWRWRFLKFRDI